MAHSYEEKLTMARACKPGDVWTNSKTGRAATIVGRQGWNIRLQHESGRLSMKKAHYFAGDYEPGAPIKASNAVKAPAEEQKSYSYEDKLKLARACSPGDVWTNIKTGRTATVVCRHRGYIHLQHESGRQSKKQDHYFAGDFDPGVSDNAAKRIQAPTDNFEYCLAILRKTSAKLQVSRKTRVIHVDIRGDLQVEFRPSAKALGSGLWHLCGRVDNKHKGVHHLVAYIKTHGARAA